ncbi:protein of unknown function [Lactiplantibacillus plantarum]
MMCFFSLNINYYIDLLVNYRFQKKIKGKKMSSRESKRLI